MAFFFSPLNPRGAPMISFLGSIPGLDGGPSYLGALDWLQPVVTVKARSSGPPHSLRRKFRTGRLGAHGAQVPGPARSRDAWGGTVRAAEQWVPSCNERNGWTFVGWAVMPNEGRSGSGHCCHRGQRGLDLRPPCQMLLRS